MENQLVEIKESELLNMPIDYMKLEESDFEGLEVEKTPIELKPSGFILDSNIFNIINPNEQNTVVINSGVGQGKSRFAVELATKYFGINRKKKDNYTIIFAVPYKSLISQYSDNIIQNFKKHFKTKIRIPDYNKLKLPADSHFPIHILTINCILGNPGEDSIEQNQKKERYLNGIIDYSKRTKGKIILIFDEIHDGIGNFKQDLIFNLWKFKTSGTLHKAFILSATFSEASKVVIKYISELTDKKLQIIETERKQIKDPNKLSNLHLYITNQFHYLFNDNPLLDKYIQEIIERHDNLDILLYSQRQATKILETGDIRKYLIDKYSNINLCISEENSKFLNKKDFEPVMISNKFQSNYCNIGTVFKTGINIEKKNSALIIILPSLFAAVNYKIGIFQSIIDITQSLARVRNKSDIYVIMPKPKRLISISKIDDNQKYIQVLNKIEHLKEMPTNTAVIHR